MSEQTSLIRITNPNPTISQVDSDDVVAPVLEQTVGDAFKRTIDRSQLHEQPELRQQSPSYTMDLELETEQVDLLVEERASAPVIQPDLVPVGSVRVPEAYKRFRDLEQKDRFRGALLEKMHEKWVSLYDVMLLHD